MITLRDGSMTESPMLDALESFDEVSRDFDVAQSLASFGINRGLEPINKIHLNPTLLNQHSTGGCCAFCATHFMLSEPYMGDPKVFNAEFAVKKLYHPAQRSDNFPGGEYQGASPVMQGTSMIAVLKEMMKLGLISRYEWSFNFLDFILGLGYVGPAMVATTWYESMFDPLESGEVTAWGRPVGRHCYLAYGTDVKKKKVLWANSHGPEYGIQGRFWTTFSTAQRLLKDRGEVAFPMKRG